MILIDLCLLEAGQIAGLKSFQDLLSCGGFYYSRTRLRMIALSVKGETKKIY